MKKIVFFFPWKIVSGGPYYLCHLADRLASTGKYEVFYTDYYNSLSDDILTDFRVRKIPYFGKAKEMEFFLEEPVVFITPIYWNFVVPKLHPFSKIIFINWHNECIPTLKNTWHVASDVMEQFFSLIEKTDCVSFCDITHWMAQNEYGICCRKQYVPLTVTKRDLRAKEEIISPDEINVAVLGRLSPDKIYAAIDLIDNLEKIDTNKIINIHLIGEGNMQNLLFEHYCAPNINVIRYGTLEMSQVLQVLIEKVDVLFAMGTSALDGASIGLPTVIIPNEVKPFRCDQYVFLYESVDYTLGWGVDQLEKLKLSVKSAKEIVEMVYRPGSKKKLGDACLHYCLENHTDNLSHIEQIIFNSQLTYEKLAPLINDSRTFLQKCWDQIKRALGQVKRVYSLLGIPIVMLTEVDALHFNIFVFFVPLLRTTKKSNHYSVHILPLVWIAKLLVKIWKYIFTRKNNTSDIGVSYAPQEEILRKRITRKLAGGEKIRVCLFESRISCWQFERLYHRLEQSDIFEPIVVVIPFMPQWKKEMIEYMGETYRELQQKGLRVVKGYDAVTNKYLDIKKELDPDAVFYTTFWKEHFQDYSYITRFRDIYSFLFPYGFDIVSHPWRESMNFELQNIVTRYYQTTTIHKGIAEDNMDNGGKNVYVTGSPKLDDIFDCFYIPKDIWKFCGKKKRVIWAPHHMILHDSHDIYSLSAFEDLWEAMPEIAEKYKDTLQWCFKPHPMLKGKLYTLWGKEKTDDYYEQWATRENTQFETGEFIDLFLTSDAMILDSLSFIGEYTSTGKPAFFTYGKGTKFKFNRFGREIMKTIYCNRSPDALIDEMITFLDQVVLEEQDEKKAERLAFIDKYIRPREGNLASDLIYEDMERVIIEGKCLEYKVNWGNPDEVELV